MPAVCRVLFWEPLLLVLNINNCVLTLPQNWKGIQPLVQERLSITYFFCSFRFCFHVILTLEFRSDSNNVHKGLPRLSVLQSYKWPVFILCASSMPKSLQLVTLIVTKTLWGRGSIVIPILQVWTHETERLKKHFQGITVIKWWSQDPNIIRIYILNYDFVWTCFHGNHTRSWLSRGYILASAGSYIAVN